MTRRSKKSSKKSGSPRRRYRAQEGAQEGAQFRSLGSKSRLEAQMEEEARHADLLSQQLYDQITSNDGPPDDLLWRIAKFLVANGTIQSTQRRVQQRVQQRTPMPQFRSRPA